ncbi:helix-turn-helix domain-containing protein [Streptomyces orinoci]|uniref:Helix-turn-helix domain-containing protein n=1 Tax=Streptomyces orinoci TaxID=67339 RepID=A0ABV3JVS6_STRON|nr:XRE family transcriptional regulator [Streptomyces orinoci]
MRRWKGLPASPDERVRQPAVRRRGLRGTVGRGTWAGRLEGAAPGSTERPVPGECTLLAGELRELRERSGLSLAALAGRTPYSKSCWERYLNGKKLPPRQAVDALCAVTGEPPGRLLAIRELAEQAWSVRAAPPPPAPEPDGRHRVRRAFVLTGTAVAAAALIVTLLLTAGRHASSPVETGSLAAGSYPQSYAPGCHGQECEGADPARMGCGAQGLVDTLLSHQATGGRRIEIRYAARCGAVWVRAIRLRLGDRVQLSLPGALTKEIRAAGRRDAEIYRSTAMTATDRPREVRVCLRPAEGAPECFAPE